MEYLSYLIRPKEFLALLRLQKFGKEIHNEQEAESANIRRCYEILNLTSRSFAAVTMKLDPEIRNVICIFYLVLRAMDTIEDDTTIERSRRIAMLEEFSEYLEDPSWKYCESNDHNKVVLEEFPTISSEFRQLKHVYKEIIKKICRDMGHGMIKHLDFNPQDIQQWDEYCYYVAGMLGTSLSQIFVDSGLETSLNLENQRLPNSMGLFLQKINIIRDYLDDIKDGRQFWPTSVWNKYVDKLEDFSKVENFKLGVWCANELLTNALQHVEDIITYLSNLNNESIFQFCAIPQTMAIATIEKCYNNDDIFKKVVKIRRGEAAYIISQSTDMAKVNQIVHGYVTKIRHKILASDPSALETMTRVDNILKICSKPENCNIWSTKVLFYTVLSLVAIWFYYIFGNF